MSRLQILATKDHLRICIDGNEIERVESFVVGSCANGESEPLAAIYLVPESITFEGVDIPMAIQPLTDDEPAVPSGMATVAEPLRAAAAEAAILTGYGQGKIHLHAVMSQEGVRWIAAEKDQPLVEFLRDARVPLAEIALALAKLTEERR